MLFITFALSFYYYRAHMAHRRRHQGELRRTNVATYRNHHLITVVVVTTEPCLSKFALRTSLSISVAPQATADSRGSPWFLRCRHTMSQTLVVICRKITTRRWLLNSTRWRIRRTSFVFKKRAITTLSGSLIFFLLRQCRFAWLHVPIA